MSFVEADGFKYTGQGALVIVLASSPVVIRAVSSPRGLHTCLGVTSLPSLFSQLLVIAQTVPKCLFQEAFLHSLPQNTPVLRSDSSALISGLINALHQPRGHTGEVSECKREAAGSGGDWGEYGHLGRVPVWFQAEWPGIRRASIFSKGARNLGV